MRVILVLALLAAGCAADDTVLFEEDFECGAGLCGWKATEPGAEVIETIHPGEHELHLPAANRVSRLLVQPIAIDACAEVELVTDCHWGDDNGTWRGPDAHLLGGTVLIGLPAQDYVLLDEVQDAPIQGAAAASVTTIAVDNPSWDCTVDSIRVVEPGGGC